MKPNTGMSRALPNLPLRWRPSDTGRCILTSLYGFAVDCHIKTLALDIVAHPQTDYLVQSVEDGQRDGGTIGSDRDDAPKLVHHLQRVSFDQTRRVPILADREHAGKNGTRRTADGMNAECVQDRKSV